jgi:predicted RNA-binding Zn-ribbon protein involved in translation (DUF1610 family)
MEIRYKKYMCLGAKLYGPRISLMTGPDDICPVCDSKIKPGVQTCDVCGADLMLLRNNGASVYVCPECGNELLEQATKCPKCGVEFASEEKNSSAEEVIFQCPVCNAEVPSDANKCPSCGVEFLSEEDAGAASEMPAHVNSVPAVEPVTAPDLSEFNLEKEPMKAEEVIVEVEQSFRQQENAQPAGRTGVNHQSPPTVSVAQQAPSQPYQEENEVAQPGKTGKSKISPGSGRKGLFTFIKGGRKEGETDAGPAVSASPDLQHSAAPQEKGPNLPAPSAATSKEFDNSAMKAMVQNIRSVLKFAGDVNADITEGKQYLDRSLDYLQKGQHSEAGKFIRLAKTSMEESVQGYFSEKMEIMRKQLEIENFGQERKRFLESKVRDVSSLSKAGKYDEAQSIIVQFQSELSTKASQYGEAQEMCDDLEQLLNCADDIGIDYDGSRLIFTEAKKHLATGDWSSALILAKQSRESLMHAIPSKLSNEMNRAKNDIIDAKISGLQVGEMIALLKQASAAYNEGKYDETLRYIAHLRKQFDGLMSENKQVKPR